MLPTPKGYIGLRDVIAEIMRRRHGAPRAVDLAPTKKRDTVPKGEETITEWKKWLRQAERDLGAELAGGNLGGHVDDQELPPDYWLQPEALTTLHTGILETWTSAGPELTRHRCKPVFIERAQIDRRIGAIVRPRAGRTRGTQLDDAAHLGRMGELLAASAARSARHAAMMALGIEKVTLRDEAAVKRLTRKWRTLNC